MSKGFVKPPITIEERKKLAQKFIGSAGFQSETNNEVSDKLEDKKTKIVKLNLRVPETFREEIQEIMNHTGMTMNAVCTQILWQGLKKTLKQINEDISL